MPADRSDTRSPSLAWGRELISQGRVAALLDYALVVDRAFINATPFGVPQPDTAS